MENIFWRHRHLLRVGDTVRVRVDPFFPKLGANYPIGETGEIVGFSIQSVCRTNTYTSLSPGIYLEPNWPFVRFGTSVVRNIPANSLELVDDVEYNERLKQSCTGTPHTFNLHGAFLSDLPNTSLWEGDIVRVKYGKVKYAKSGSIAGLPDAFVISSMSFVSPGEIIECIIPVWIN